LYLRGMSGDVAHQNYGVYYRDITFEELNTLDQLFLGES